MNPLSIIIGFIPQVVFMILVNWLPLGPAAAAGLAVALAVIVVTAARGGVKVLPVVQAVILAAFAVAGFTVGSHPAAVFEPYARGTASLALALFILATSAAFPFTAQFARASVPRQYWRSPRFLGVNRRISAAWGLAVLAVGAAHLVAALVGGGPVLRVLLDWGVPAYALYQAYSVTKRTIARNSDAQGPEAQNSEARNSEARNSEARNSEARNSEARNSDAQRPGAQIPEARHSGQPRPQGTDRPAAPPAR